MNKTLKIAALTATLLFVGAGVYASSRNKKLRKKVDETSKNKLDENSATLPLPEGINPLDPLSLNLFVLGQSVGKVPNAGDPVSFVKFALPFAVAAEKKTGVPAIFAVAQSALETGWGRSVKGNAFFGIKATGKSYGGWGGQKECFLTTEFYPLSTWNSWAKAYHEKQGKVTVESVSNGKVKAKVYDCFRKYPSPYNSFMDWGGMLSKNPRYANAMRYTNNPNKFAEEVAKAGYATSPTYSDTLKQMIASVNTKMTTT